MRGQGGVDVIGNEYFDQMVAAAPVNFDSAKVDWAGIKDLLEINHINPSEVSAVTWCSFGVSNIEALVDAPALTIIYPGGVVSSVGKRKTFGGALKFNELNFKDCRQISEEEYTDDRGLGKFCIEFVGPGGILLGRLQWSWRAKRFRDSRAEIMAVASERDRIMEVVRTLAG
jgi:hypothetical protein